MEKWVAAQQELCRNISEEVGTQIQTIVNGNRVPVTIEDIKKMKTVQVHNGVFHADDVYCVALLKKINPDIKIIRSRGQEKVDLRCDVGLGPYDHHGKEDAEYRHEDEEYNCYGRYAAFGKLWHDLGPSLVGQENAAAIDQTLAEPIDRADNGEEPNPLSALISSFVPAWDGKESMDSAFNKAVAVASQDIGNRIEYSLSLLRAQEVVHDAMENMHNGIVEFTQYTPWNDNQELIGSDAKFVIFPASTGEQWNLQCVPPEVGSFAQKEPIVFDKTGFGEGCKFVHPGKFFAAFTTKEAAEKAAEMCRKYYREKEHAQTYDTGTQERTANKSYKNQSLQSRIKNAEKDMPKEEKKEIVQKTKAGQGHTNEPQAY